MGFNSLIECNENDLIMLLKLTFKSVEIYNSQKGTTDAKEDLAKLPVFQQLARQIASFVYGSRIENTIDLDVILIYVRDAMEFTFEYVKINKDAIDAIDISQEDDTKKYIVEQMLNQVHGLQPYEIFMKHAGIESKLNAFKTNELIEDIKIFSGSFVQSASN